MSAPIMINNTVSRTCVAVRSLDGGQRITDLSSVTVVVRPRNQIPFGQCEPIADTSTGYGCGLPVMGQDPSGTLHTPCWLYYPAHDFNEDRTRICFHWDGRLWSQPAGRYMATVYLCGTAIGCFQMQVGKRFTVEDPINVAFNLLDATVAICTPDVLLCSSLPAVVPPGTIGWYSNVVLGTGALSATGGTLTPLVETNVYHGGVLLGVAPGAVLSTTVSWVPAAWGSFTLGQQVAPFVSIDAFGTISVAPQRVYTGALNQVSCGTVQVSASIDGVTAHNQLVLTVSPTGPSGALLAAWSVTLT